MAKKEQIVREDKGALAVIAEANEQMKAKKQVAIVTLTSPEQADFDLDGNYIRAKVEYDDIIGYSGAENWFVIQKRDGVVIYNRDEVSAVEIIQKDVE